MRDPVIREECSDSTEGLSGVFSSFVSTEVDEGAA